MNDIHAQNTKSEIRSLRATLSAEKRKFGCYDDSYGRRYIIPELYLKIKDYNGALRYFRWFEKEFPDDIGFSDFLFYWTATLFENNKPKLAKKKAFQTLFSNVFLLEMLCDRDLNIDGYIGYSNINQQEFADSVVGECRNFVSPEFLLWIFRFINSNEYHTILNQYLALDKQIKAQEIGLIRTKLLEKQRELKEKAKEL